MNAQALHEIVKDVDREAWPKSDDGNWMLVWRDDREAFWWKSVENTVWSSSEPNAGAHFTASMTAWLAAEAWTFTTRPHHRGSALVMTTEGHGSAAFVEPYGEDGKLLHDEATPDPTEHKMLPTLVEALAAAVRAIGKGRG